MNNLDKGQRSEAMFLVYCAEQSIESAIPLLRSAPYDFVALIDGKWSTVQVKTVFGDRNGHGNPNRVISLRHAGEGKLHKPYEQGDYDYVFCVDKDRRWLIPASACSHIRSTLTLGRKVAKYEI